MIFLKYLILIYRTLKINNIIKLRNDFNFRYMKKSGLNSQLNKSLKSLVDTRWNTAHRMLQSILESYDGIIQLLVKKDKLDKLNSFQRHEASTICEFLKFFTSKTLLLEADECINFQFAWPTLDELKNYLKIQTNDSEIIKDMKKSAEEYLEDPNRINLLTSNIWQRTAVFLTPPMRSLKMLQYFERCEVKNFVKSSISVSIHEIDMNESNENTFLNDEWSSRITSKSLPNFMSSFIDDDDSFAESSSTSNIASDEINRYTDLKIAKNDLENFDLCKWWNENRKIFPNLYKLFLRVIAIPCTSAASERCFSKTSHLITDLRSQIKPCFVNDLIILNQYCSGKISI